MTKYYFYFKKLKNINKEYVMVLWENDYVKKEIQTRYIYSMRRKNLRNMSNINNSISIFH